MALRAEGSRLLVSSCLGGSAEATRKRSRTMETFTVTPIGVVKSPRKEPIDDFWGDLISEIHLDRDRFSPEALAGLADFSHAEILFLMHKVPPGEVETKARHPRGRADWPLVGIFGQRGKARPNRIGLSRCAIEKVEG